MSNVVVDPEVAEVLQYTNVDYFEDEESVIERPVDDIDGKKKPPEKEQKPSDEEDLRNKNYCLQNIHWIVNDK